MICPKCEASMTTATYESVDVERCSSCAGLWLDIREDERLRGLQGAESLDTGAVSRGKELNEMGNVDCPVCHMRMLRMVDARQPHVWFESCSICYGVFLDAGELKDLKEETLREWFRFYTTKPRKYTKDF